VLLTANYFVQKIFGATVGEKVVDMQGELPGGVFAGATVTTDRLIIKLVNTNSDTIHAQLHLGGIPDGRAQVEYLQSDDLNAANRMTFHGAPEYQVVPKTMEITVKNFFAVLDLKLYGFYAPVVNR
jgi:hypothetical protein